MKIKKLDELQLIKRGNIFKHCLFAIIGLLLLYIAMIELDIVFLSHSNTLILMIIFVVSMFCIEMIHYEIYPLSEKRQRFAYLFAGLFGTAAIIASIYEMVSGAMGFIENDMLSDAGAGVLMGSLFLAILLAYVCKLISNKKKSEAES